MSVREEARCVAVSQDSDGSLSSSTSGDGSQPAASLDQMHDMTAAMEREECAQRQLEAEQQAAREAEMMRRREDLRQRLDLARVERRSSLASAKASASVSVRGDPLDDTRKLRTRHRRATTSWTQWIWQKTCHATRYAMASMSMTSSIDFRSDMEGNKYYTVKYHE